VDEERNPGGYWSGIGHSDHPLGDGNLAEIRARASRTDLDAAIHGLLPERVLRITTVSVIDAYDVVRLEDEVVPAREPPSRDNAKAYVAWARQNIWLLSGRDDLGTRYEDWGAGLRYPSGWGHSRWAAGPPRYRPELRASRGSSVPRLIQPRDTTARSAASAAAVALRAEARSLASSCPRACASTCRNVERIISR
jgi:hypothetical protein